MSTTMTEQIAVVKTANSTDIPPGYKQTEMGVIPEDWEVVTIGNRVDLLTGFPFPSSGYSDSGVLLVRGSNIKRGKLDWDEGITKYWSNITLEIVQYQLHEGDIVIAMDGALVGRSYAVIKAEDLPCLLLQRVARIRSSQVYQGLLTWWIASTKFVQYVNSVKTHTAIPHISSSDIESFAIAIPSEYSEQHAIASTLSDVDALLSSLEKLIAKKRMLKKATMEELLSGKKRLPEFSGEWKTCTLGSLGTFAKGQGIKRDEVSDYGIACVRYGELYTRYNNYILNPVSKISRMVSLTARPIKAGDLLFAGSGETSEEIGRCAAYLGNERAYAGGDIIILSPINQDSLYLGYLMNYKDVVAQKARMGQGDAVVHISATSLSRIVIDLPPIEVAKLIGTGS